MAVVTAAPGYGGPTPIGPDGKGRRKKWGRERKIENTEEKKRETLGEWTDGRISCRHSAPTSFHLLNAERPNDRQLQSVQ